MTTEQLEKRRRVMRRSIALGHCICDVQEPCPCDLFKQQDICHCAGEQPANRDEQQPIRLTEYVSNAGCASKISKGVLQQVLAGLPEIEDPRVLVGATAGDDAGVILLSKDTATIFTVDVFTPSVDDPYTFGRIAAANSLSDIYAMGGTPQTALSIIGFPIHRLPAFAMREILRGGADTMKQAGVPIIGGHSINDPEIKCGFAVLGTSPASSFVRNAGAQVGDVIVLTKPLGGGIAAFANQLGRISPEHMERVAQSMASLNKSAGRLMVQFTAHAATDVTGFSLLGHMAEIVRNSNVRADLDFDRIPIFDGVAELARQDVIPGAIERNRESVDPAMLDLSLLTTAQQAILFCPETSGGMLVFLEAPNAEAFCRALEAEGVSARVIGKVAASHPGGLIRATSEHAEQWKPLALIKAQKTEAAVKREASEPLSCCADGADSAVAATAAPEAPAAAATDRLPAPAAANAFKDYMTAVGDSIALGARQGKLIAVALSVMSKCEPCVKINVRAAREAGASEQEIAEAVALALAFGGAPVAMFYNTMRK